MPSSYELMTRGHELKLQLLEAFDPETGEVDEELYEQLTSEEEALQVSIQDKAVRMYHVIESARADIPRLRAEAKSSNASVKRLQSLIDRLTPMLFGLVEMHDSERLELPTGGYLRNTTRTTSGFEVTNPAYLPDDCTRRVADPAAIRQYKAAKGSLPPGTIETTKISQTTRRR